MTLDNALIGPVSHYIGGMIGAAAAIHSEAQAKGFIPELVEEIERARTACIARSEEMLANPAQYAKIDGYQLPPADRTFLEELLQSARESDWHDPAQVQSIASYVGQYVPGWNLI